MERNKAAYIHTGHKTAGDDPAKPWTANFTSEDSAWGIKGVQCNVCHGTARSGQDDLLQVSATTGAPKYASGHQNLALGTAATQLCFECHGTATTPATDNPAAVIPVSAGEFSNTSFGLAPIGNQFLNSPHAKYTGDSVPLSLINTANYGSTFVGYNCRTSANGSSYVSSVYQTGEVGLIHFLDSLTNTDCTNTGDGSAASGAARLVARLPAPRPFAPARLARAAGGIDAARKGSRRAWFGAGTGYLDCPVFDRYRLGAGHAHDGAAFVEERETTTLVGPGGGFEVNDYGMLIVHVAPHVPA